MKKLYFALAMLLCILVTSNAMSSNYAAVVNPIGVIEQTVTYASFTDGGSTAGTLSLTPTLPLGAIPIAWRAVVSAGFTGDTSATLLVGVSGDTDKFSASDGQNIFAAGTYGDSALGEAVGCDAINAAQTVLLTLTSASDFTSVVTAANGSMVIKIYYLRP